MMKDLAEIKKQDCIEVHAEGEDGFACVVKLGMIKMEVICSNGGGWDHVSAQGQGRVPSWAEMCILKDLFFGPEECVVQYHPAKSEYVNLHSNVLHLWKPQFMAIPTPPIEFV